MILTQDYVRESPISKKNKWFNSNCAGKSLEAKTKYHTYISVERKEVVYGV